MCPTAGARASPKSSRTHHEYLGTDDRDRDYYAAGGRIYARQSSLSSRAEEEEADAPARHPARWVCRLAAPNRLRRNRAQVAA